ncbi:lipoprotein [Halalkalibacter alkaliphilus]|uniref:Uncharacterized protein n=1 Tax=Halalkalibacter alkaliphilus TaxID=2917993 RepID=A0A9X2CTJ7_9BACI|nr:hypothetical protein [Halalkalibacter alkaliphilus]MCL7748005.1 hypothetical protein [Halalkalibacter alkaliphilus]
MKRIFLVAVIILSITLLAACGGAKNSTPLEASETFMKSLVDGDMQLNASINHSDDWSFPADHMISIANERNIVGMDLSDFTYEQDEDNPRLVTVTWNEEDGTERSMLLNFNQTSDGYFFVKLGR